MKRKAGYFTVLLWFIFSPVLAQQNTALIRDSAWSFHFQFTGIIQAHPNFHSPYSGQNSLRDSNERAFSVTTTIFLGRKLWKGASVYFNPEMAGGRGVGNALGIAGFTNGETFRIGNPEPVVYIGRIFLRQHINLDKDHFEKLEDDVNHVSENVSTSRLTITAGKFGVADFFDNNLVSHDPRTDFMNWGLMNNGAYDYAANTRGYTYGIVIEYVKPGWTLRAGTALEPSYANGPTLDWHFEKTNGETVEFEKRFAVRGHKGNLRVLGYYNVTKAPAYDAVVAANASGADTSMDVIYGKEYGGKKYGFGINADQDLGGSLNGFLRVGWNDGKTATWAFAEIDNSASVGLRLFGKKWNRDDDNIGLAILSNGISSEHRNFLNAGGYGFMLGDGKLPNYTRENIIEFFYQLKLLSNVSVSADYQFVGHPAYNKDRGPVNLFAARVHVAL